MLSLEADPVAGRIVITSDYPFRDKDRVKQLPGSRYDIDHNRWSAPLTWATCRALRGIFSDELDIRPSLVDWATEERARRVDPALAMRTAWDADGDADLYPFQRAGVRFMQFARRALLCDEMGTGKTVQTIRTLVAMLRDSGEQTFPVIVVAPNNMVYTWRNEFAKWWPGLNVAVVKGSAAERVKILADESVHVFVMNFELVKSHSRLAPYGSVRLKRCVVCDPTLPDVVANKQARCEWCKKELNLRPWKTIIVDEAHRMKDPKTKQTRACWALLSDATEFVYCLTGTAIADSPIDLWPSLHMISPDEFPSRGSYIERYCLQSYNPFGGMKIIGLRPDTAGEFFDIVDPRMRRMPKEAVLPFLPKKTYSERYVEMTPKQKTSYKQMAEGMMAIVDNAIVVAQSPLVALTRLTQFASAYAEVDETGKVKLSAPSNKVDALVEILEEMGDKPAVVFAQSRQLIELACAKLDALKITYSKITGGQTAEERELEKGLFQDGHRRVILCTIAAGGIGITLTRSDTAIFLQRSWSMIDNSQAEDRVHRIGSEVHDKIYIIDVISVDTIEEPQRVALSQKGDRLEEIMRDRDTVEQLVTKGQVF